MSSEHMLFKAIELDYIKLAKKLLKKDPNLINGYNIGVLFNVLKSGKMLSILFSIYREKFIDFFEMHDELILFSAITKKKELEIIKEILLFDRDIVNNESKSGDTPLLHAIKKNSDINVIKLLLLNNADVNKCTSQNESPLHLADKLEVVKILIENGASVNCCSRRGLTPLMKAIVYRRDREIIFELIKNGSDLNVCDDRGRTPLHLALYQKYDESVILEIISKITCIDAEDDDGLTPLCYALDERMCGVHKYYTKDFISDLIRKGAVLNTTVLMYAIQYCKNLQIINEFINTFGADVRSVDSSGNGVLHYVSDVKMINFLIYNGAFINHKNNSGVTPLVEALRSKKDVKVIQSLLSFGADVTDLEFYFKENNFVLQERDAILNMMVLNGIRITLDNRCIKNIFYRILNKLIKSSSFTFEANNYSILRHILLSKEEVIIPCNYLQDNKISEFLQNYYSELNYMKEISIIDNLSFYNFCMKYYKSSRYAINNCEFVNNNYAKIKRLFPLFYDVIIVKVKINEKIHNRLKLMKKLFGISIKSFSEPQAYDPGCKIIDTEKDSSQFVEIISDCLYEVSRYLNYRELSCLLLAAVKS